MITSIIMSNIDNYKLFLTGKRKFGNKTSNNKLNQLQCKRKTQEGEITKWRKE